MANTLSETVHVLYGGAHLFRADSAQKMGQLALASLDAWAREPLPLEMDLGSSRVAERVRKKLAEDPVEAMCIDFEDGFGARSDEVEDAEAVRSASELAKIATPKPIIGMRIKALSGESERRAAKTLELFVTTFAKATGGALRDGFTITLPKVTSPGEPRALAAKLDALEDAHGIARGRIGIELMIESPPALFDPAGALAPRELVAAAGGRCVAVHLGAYDLLASVGVLAPAQRLDHPLCDLARAFMKLALAESGVAVFDGVTTELPLPVHSAKDRTLSEVEIAENRAAILRGWSRHASNVRRALDLGIFQGWDVHPAQLPARYGAIYGYFLTHRAQLAKRLRAFVEHAATASRVGQVFDDAATARGLVAFFRRGLACGAFDDGDVAETSLGASELRSRSFEEIVRSKSDARR